MFRLAVPSAGFKALGPSLTAGLRWEYAQSSQAPTYADPTPLSILAISSIRAPNSSPNIGCNLHYPPELSPLLLFRDDDEIKATETTLRA
jgi:hypothetical protein